MWPVRVTAAEILWPVLPVPVIDNRRSPDAITCGPWKSTGHNPYPRLPLSLSLSLSLSLARSLSSLAPSLPPSSSPSPQKFCEKIFSYCFLQSPSWLHFFSFSLFFWDFFWVGEIWYFRPFCVDDLISALRRLSFGSDHLLHSGMRMSDCWRNLRRL